MARGPGKYDDLTTLVRTQAQAKCAIVMIFGGNKGDGFSVQAELEVLVKLPALLREMASQIEADLAAPHWPELQ